MKTEKHLNANLLRAENRHGRISLWVKGWCIWDLPRSALTPDVQSAIIHAYELGRRQARKRPSKLLCNNPDEFPLDTQFKLPPKRRRKK